jgi:hypothetical protein
MNVDYRIAINWDAVAPGVQTMTYSATDNNNGAYIGYDYTIEITVVDTGSASAPPPPANTAPTAGTSGSVIIAAGAALQASDLNNTNTGSSDPDSDTLTYSLTGGTVSAPSNAAAPERKGSSSIGSQSYSIDDGHSHTANGSVAVYATYQDDPTTWTTGPTNQTWNISGLNSYTLTGGADPDDSVSYSYVSGTKPTWMTVASNGTVSGNVAPEFANQSYSLTVRATGSTTVDKAFTINTTVTDAADLNDQPTATGAAQSINEDAALTFATGNFNFADLDHSAGGSSASGAVLTSIRIDTLTSHGTLKLGTTNVVAGEEIAVSAIGTLTYTSSTDYSGSDSYTYSVNDGIDWSASPATMALTVTPSNDAPVLVDGVPVLSAITENATTNTDVGNLVSDLIARNGGGAVLGNKSGMTDVDTLNNGGAGNAPESVGLGIAIHSTTVNGPSTGGVWQFKLASGGSWTNFGNVSDSAALLLKSTDSVRFLPDGKNGQTASFDYYAWDQFSGSAGSTANVSARGGSTAFSTASDSASITVSDVNDAPTIAKPAAQTVAEDFTIGITGISFSDVDIVDRVDSDTTNDNLQATLSVLHGTITLAGTSGITVDAGANTSASLTITGSLTAINTAVATLTYAPGVDYSGADTLSLSVNDTTAGNVGSGGILTTTDTLAITVTPSNDAPVLVDGVPLFTTRDENATTNDGNLVSDLLAGTAGGANSGNKTGRTDVDTLNNFGLGNSPEAVGQGIAIFATNNAATPGAGTWEYSINGGSNWSAIGTVSSASALMLSATDRVRFVPDTENGTTATLQFYAWDEATGAHGTKVNPGARGGNTAFSLLTDTATITITNVNDAPVMDLDGDNSSQATGSSANSNPSYTGKYLMRGNGVKIADSDISITDVDKTDSTHPDTLVSATVTTTSGAFDNIGTNFEKLTAASTSVTGSLGTITVTGNNSASLSISGTGTWAEYQNIIKAVIYQNTNADGIAGARTITVSVTDGHITEPGATAATVSTTSTITNVWAPVIDVNGPNTTGTTKTATYTEGDAALVIASPDATITDQDGNLSSVVISISNVQNSGNEALTIAAGTVTTLNGLGITVGTNNTSTITLSGDLASSV